MFLAACSFSLTGCGSGNHAVPASGKIMWKNKPLEYGIVWFIPENKELSPAQGEIQADGSFELEIPRVSSGAQVGNYKIWVSCYKSQNPQMEGKEVFNDKYLLPKKYQSTENSGLTAAVTKNGTNYFALTL